MIKDVKTSLANDLILIQTNSGYNNTIKKVHKKVKQISELNKGDYPCFCITMPTATRSKSGEQLHIDSVDCYVFGYKEITGEDPEGELLDLYEDVCTRLDRADSYLHQNQQVDDYEISGYGIDPSGNIGFIVIPIKINYIN